jgi:hypothetical protein
MLLADGKPKKAAEIYELAEKQGFASATIRRAGKILGLKCFQVNRCWYWKADQESDITSFLFNNILESKLESN